VEVGVISDIVCARDALWAISPDMTNDEWFALAAAAMAAGLSFDDFDRWSEKGNTYNVARCRSMWKSIKPGKGITAGTLFKRAIESGWVPHKQDTPQQQAQQAPRVVQDAPDVQPEPQGLSHWAQRLWAHECKPLSGVALDYLKYRHCAIPPEDGDLRCHPALKHPTEYVGPCLVALITDARTQAPLSLHRTWITPTGKAGIQPPRLLLKDHSIKNGVIRLWPDDEVNALLGVAEGIETALSLAHAPLCVWSVIDAGHLSKFPVLNGITTLVIAQDKDPAGIAAASICARRWAAAGRYVRVTRQTANDLNDSLAEAKE